MVCDSAHTVEGSRLAAQLQLAPDLLPVALGHGLGRTIGDRFIEQFYHLLANLLSRYRSSIVVRRLAFIEKRV